jgi:uncharacterized protein
MTAWSIPTGSPSTDDKYYDLTAAGPSGIISCMDHVELNRIPYLEISLWLDFYGQLLTGHTREVLELHYCEDMSLSEIAENLGITRQAVHDRIRQGVQSLATFESKLNLASRYRVQKECLDQALQAFETGQCQQVQEKLLQLSGLI